MSLSNYPPGMSRSDMDHVEGITRCVNCHADISRAWENGEVEDESCPECPDGCAPEYDPSDPRI